GAHAVGRGGRAGQPEHHRRRAGPLTLAVEQAALPAFFRATGWQPVLREDMPMPVLSEQLRDKIRAYFPRYPSKQAVTLPALHLVHDELRCVPLEAIREIAELLELSPAEVHDTMSFYGIFRGEDNKLGQTRLWVCRGLACALRGGEETLRTVCEKLHVKP